MLAEEITAHIQRNRLPIITWSCIVILPALIVGAAVAGWHGLHTTTVQLPGSVAEISATPSDRTWSIYQAFDCVRSACDDEQSARAVIVSASADAVSLSTDSKTETVTLAALSDAQWLALADEVTANGSMSVSDVVGAVKDTSTTAASFRLGAVTESFAFTAGKRQALTSIVIGGAE